MWSSTTLSFFSCAKKTIWFPELSTDAFLGHQQYGTLRNQKTSENAVFEFKETVKFGKWIKNPSQLSSNHQQ